MKLNDLVFYFLGSIFGTFREEQGFFPFLSLIRITLRSATLKMAHKDESIFKKMNVSLYLDNFFCFQRALFADLQILELSGFACQAKQACFAKRKDVGLLLHTSELLCVAAT